MSNLRKSYRFRLVSIATALLFLMNVGLTNAQSSKSKIISSETKNLVEVKQGNLLNVENAKLEKLIIRENKENTEFSRLSFFVPFEFESFIPKSKLILTAFNENGSVRGMKIWRDFAPDFKYDNSAKPIPFSLNLSSDFVNAYRFSLNTVLKTSADIANCSNLAGGCRECLDLAIEGCGAGKIAGVKCPKDGSCEFTCKP